MIAIIQDAKAGWSGEVQKGRTTLRFVDWMPTYLTNEKYVRRWQGVGHLAESAQRIGRMYGIPDDAMRRAGK